MGAHVAWVGGALGREGGRLGEAAGFPEAAGPLEDFVSGRTRAVADVGAGVETLGEVVGLAATAYRRTDATAMPTVRG